MDKISVVITTYNHEKYVNQCLESILSQQGDFSLEIIVGDDCSTDNTRDTVQQSLDQYPRTVHLLPYRQNLGITKNLERCLDACSGRYVAICEGDDYWTDRHKLQKQKELLETHPEYSMCFSAVMLYYEDSNKYVPHGDQVNLQKDCITTEDLIGKNYIGNFSCCMYRTEVVRMLPKSIFDIFTVDWMFNMACGQIGNIGYIRQYMSVYRLHSGGAWTGKRQLEKMEDLKRYIDVYNEFFDFKYDALFMKQKRAVCEEIVHLRRIEEEGKYNVKSLVPRKYNQLVNAVKQLLRTIGGHT